MRLSSRNSQIRYVRDSGGDLTKHAGWHTLMGATTRRLASARTNATRGASCSRHLLRGRLSTQSLPPAINAAKAGGAGMPISRGAPALRKRFSHAQDGGLREVADAYQERILRAF